MNKLILFISLMSA